MPNTIEDDTAVNESYSVTVPASVRDAADIEAGDRIRWRVTEDGTLEVDVVKRQRGAFTALEAVELDEPTDAATDHDFVAGEY